MKESRWYMNRYHILTYGALSSIIISSILFILIYEYFGAMNFALSVEPSYGEIRTDNFIQSAVLVQGINAYGNPITLTAKVPRSGIKVNFSPQSGIPSFSSIVTIGVNKSLPRGNYTIAIDAAGSNGETDEAIYILKLVNNESKNM